MICDVHAHYTPKNFSEFMGDRFASPTHLAVKRGLARHPFSDTQEDIEARFRLMEDAGVGRQVLSIFPRITPVDQNNVPAAPLQMQRGTDSHHSCSENDYVRTSAHPGRRIVS
jgi:hypothetical protein